MGIFQKREEEYRISQINQILPQKERNSTHELDYNDDNENEDKTLINGYEEEEKELLEKKPKGTVIIYGFLKKQSKYLMKWKTRFCILTNHYLFAFTGVENDADCTFAFNIINATGVEKVKEKDKNNYTFVIKSYEHNYYFRAEEDEFREIWINEINKLLKFNKRQMDSFSSIYE